MYTNRQRAFTLIELLVSISIIAVLATFVIVASQKLFGGNKQKTQVIISTIKKAIEIAAAQTGSSVAMVEHPLAGSRTPFAFNAAGKPSELTIGAEIKYSTGKNFFKGCPRWYLAPVGTGSTALGWQATSSTGSISDDELLDGEDFYANKSVPLLYGVKRKYLTILGALQVGVTKYTRLKWADEGQIRSGSWKPNGTSGVGKQFLGKVDPDIAADLLRVNKRFQVPDGSILMEPDSGNVSDFSKGVAGYPANNKEAIDQVLGVSGMQGELVNLGAIRQAYDLNATGYPLAATNAQKPYVDEMNNVLLNGTAQDKALIFGKRDSDFESSVNGKTLPLVLFQSSPDVNLPTDAWRAGCIKVGGEWKPYRLPGVALYDAWGNELLMSYSSLGLRVTSAGQDGCFRIRPAKNSSELTSELSSAIKGNYAEGEADARQDNLGDVIEDTSL